MGFNCHGNIILNETLRKKEKDSRLWNNFHENKYNHFLCSSLVIIWIKKAKLLKYIKK